MKRNYLFSLLIFTFFSTASLGQTSKFVGTWLGTLKVGIDLRIVFHIAEDGKGGFITTADSPDQSAYGLKCDTTTIKDNQVTIDMKDLMAVFTGKLEDDSTINGVFTQQAALPVVLKKTGKVTEKNRPQTPRPPFPYRSEELIYTSADKSLSYGATITIPEGKGPFPAAVLITGSGPQDRDETIMGHKPFAVIADDLARKGFIILRVDDRGVGKSTGSFAEATSEDFATDVNNSVDYLLSRKEVDKKKIGLIGHSEGGMIAPMVAAKRNDINFLVLLAAPGVRIIDLMAEQNVAIARSGGVSEGTLKEIKPLFKQVVVSIIQAPDSSTAVKNVTLLTETWAADKSKSLLKELDFETAKQRSEYIIEMVRQFQSPWFRYFINFNPAQYLELLSCKVLALNGDKDIQVISGQNLPGIEAALKKSKSRSYEIKELPGMNHLFQVCKKCTINEYGELEETISPALLDIVSDWLDKNVK
jgi:uncharacterized protein